MSKALTRQEHEDQIRRALESTLAVHSHLADEQAAHADTRATLDAVTDSRNSAEERVHWLEQQLAMMGAKLDHAQRQVGSLTAELELAASMLQTNADRVRARLTAAQVGAYGARGRQVMPMGRIGHPDDRSGKDPEDESDPIPRFLRDGEPLQ